MFDYSVITFGLPILLRGLLATIIYCAIGTVIGASLGLLVAMMRLSRSRILQIISTMFVELFRNTPFLVQAFLIYFGLAQWGIRLSAPVAGVVILSIYGAAQFSEIIRSAIQSVPRGQLESARALGIPYVSAMRRIVVPQSMNYLVPTMTNQVIGLIKESAALAIITVPELSMASQKVVGETFRPVETYLITAVIYWLLTTAVARGLREYTNYLGRRRNHAPPSAAPAASMGPSHE